ncbi:TIGR04141 family sporadically distributed protein [Pseudomonas sp. RC2C2]|uniref:TIGR04141 family sporadically distributed protein n=1 Tax=Pseudomonas sp. RC2C2 TaxID=2834408 RepID=UPI001BCD4D6F|nr:TIGR04141 family sporadically distributed protein [Pseudomonas sp. RC2C2]MBS7597807.1 TIGR04141 family sporadically distributed protein [Pseudomonas sp. RC2C2]
MPGKKYRHLNIFLKKPEVTYSGFADLLAADKDVVAYETASSLELNGVLYVKRATEKKPNWSDIADEIAGQTVTDIGNKSSSAVLFIRVDNDVFAIAFGYGRHLIDLSFFVQDFGLKTALNTLDHESLRSVDIHTLDDQPVQKKSQAARDSEISVFGIDISKDILRAVTGTPKIGVEFKNISGGDAMFSFGIEMEIGDLADIARTLKSQYQKNDYKANFLWVDNVRKVKEKSRVDHFDGILLAAIKARDSNIVLTLPEIEKWDSIAGFSFTRTKSHQTPTISTDLYLANIDVDKVSIESVKRDQLHVFDIHDNEFSHSIYKCIYYEVTETNKTTIIFGGTWYEIDNSFMGRTNASLARIAVSPLRFPQIHTWVESNKTKIEAEGDYNIRAAQAHSYYLLDKRLIKSNKSTSSVELCDLLTSAKQFVHVKHRKGGSAGLSHLFAQGSVAAEILLGDRDFRKSARKVLATFGSAARDLVPIDNFKSSDYEVVFLILGDEPITVKDNLPFFSKVNLVRAYDNLSQRGYTVSISAASKIERPQANP